MRLAGAIRSMDPGTFRLDGDEAGRIERVEVEHALVESSAEPTTGQEAVAVTLDARWVVHF